MYISEFFKKNNFSIVLLSLFVLFPLLTTGMQSVVIIILVVISWGFYRQNFFFRIQDKKLLRTYFIITGYVWFALLSFFWSENKHAYFVEVRPTLSLIFFPFIFLFFLPKIKEDEKVKIYLTFIFGMAIYSILWFNHQVEGISIYQEKILHEIPVREFSLLDQLNYFKQKTFRGWVNGIANRGHLLGGNTSFFVHYTYISAFLNLAMLICVFLLRKKIKKGLKVLCGFLLMFFTFFLIYLTSYINIAFLLVVFLFGVTYLIKSKKIRWFVIICSFLFGGLIAKDKIIRVYKDLDKWQLVSSRYRNYDGRQVIDYLRYTILECSIEQIKQSPIIGIGLGDYQEYLSNCLKTRDQRNKIDHTQEYNTHSQFLHFFLVGGIINGVLFLVCLGFFVINSIRSRNPLFISFLLLLLLNLSFENFLNRIWGVLFVVLFLMIIPNWKQIPSIKKEVQDLD